MISLLVLLIDTSYSIPKFMFYCTYIVLSQPSLKKVTQRELRIGSR